MGGVGGLWGLDKLYVQPDTSPLRIALTGVLQSLIAVYGTVDGLLLLGVQAPPGFCG